MIHVEPQPEPADFDRRVRQPGRRDAAGRRALWRRCLRQLWDAYDGVCAYSCLRVPWLTGAVTVDHFIPRSQRPDLAHEWTNFRLACLRMNSRKWEAVDVLDPFEVRDGWFVLELSSLEVLPNTALGVRRRRRVEATIARLGLNEPESIRERAGHYDDYLRGDLSFDLLKRWSPFVARELMRQHVVAP